MVGLFAGIIVGSVGILVGKFDGNFTVITVVSMIVGAVGSLEGRFVGLYVAIVGTFVGCKVGF